MGDIVPFTDDGLPDDEFAPAAAGCPSCGERRVDALTIDMENEAVDCASCGSRYYLPGSLRRLVSDLIAEQLGRLPGARRVFEVLPASGMPTASRPEALAHRVRLLRPGEAIFVPARAGETVSQLGNRLSYLHRRHGVRQRADRRKGGIWLYREGAEKGAAS